MTAIGLLSPNLSEHVLDEVRRILPPSISVCGRGFVVRQYTNAEFKKAKAALMRQAQDLAHSDIDFLMVTGELFLSFLGPDSDKLLLKELREVTQVPASTIVTAVSRAFSALRMNRIVMASPFPEDQTQRHVSYLRQHGMDVLDYTVLGYRTSAEIWALPPESGYEAAADLIRRRPDADGVYMPCNQWRVTSIIDRLERDFGKPVVANTPAWIHDALLSLGHSVSLAGWGRLLSELRQ